MRRGITGLSFAPWLGRLWPAVALALAVGLAAPGGASAQFYDCARLRAAIDAMPGGDPAAAQAAAQVRASLERFMSRADAIGCNNQPFLFFGSPPPPECGGLQRRIAGLRAQYEALRARAGDNGRRQALIAQFAEQCGGDLAPDNVEAPREPERGAAHGGGEAICVRKCDGYYFPLTPAMSAGRSDQLRDLCQASCPNAETELFSRAPQAEIAAAVSSESGERYGDLPNALKYTKKLDPTCSCRKPKQNWADVLGRAEDILTEIEGERPGEGPLTVKQADERSRIPPPAPAVAEKAPLKPKKKPRTEPPALSPLDPPAPF